MKVKDVFLLITLIAIIAMNGCSGQSTTSVRSSDEGTLVKSNKTTVKPISFSYTLTVNKIPVGLTLTNEKKLLTVAGKVANLNSPNPEEVKPGFWVKYEPVGQVLFIEVKSKKTIDEIMVQVCTRKAGEKTGKTILPVSDGNNSSFIHSGKIVTPYNVFEISQETESKRQPPLLKEAFKSFREGRQGRK